MAHHVEHRFRRAAERGLLPETTTGLDDRMLGHRRDAIKSSTAPAKAQARAADDIAIPGLRPAQGIEGPPAYPGTVLTFAHSS